MTATVESASAIDHDAARSNASAGSTGGGTSKITK